MGAAPSVVKSLLTDRWPVNGGFSRKKGSLLKFQPKLAHPVTLSLSVEPGLQWRFSSAAVRALVVTPHLLF